MMWVDDNLSPALLLELPWFLIPSDADGRQGFKDIKAVGDNVIFDIERAVYWIDASVPVCWNASSVAMSPM